MTRDHFEFLGQVVTERSEDHAVQPLWRDAGLRASSGTNARPGLTGYVGVLGAEAETALGSAVELVPEAGCTLDDRSRVGDAIGECSRSETGSHGRRQFRVTARIAEQGRAVADLLARDGIEARGARGILGSGVEVDIELPAVQLERGQALQVLDEMEGSIRVNREIGELSGAVTAHSAAAEAVQAEGDVTMVEVPAGIDANAAAFLRGVIGLNGAGCGESAAGRAGEVFLAREHPVGEAVGQAVDLVVTKA